MHIQTKFPLKRENSMTCESPSEIRDDLEKEKRNIGSDLNKFRKHGSMVKFNPDSDYHQSIGEEVKILESR